MAGLLAVPLHYLPSMSVYLVLFLLFTVLKIGATVVIYRRNRARIRRRASSVWAIVSGAVRRTLAA